MLRFHGSRDKVTYEQVGYNSRLDELQAAILRVQLPHLDAWADHRRQAARWYADAGLGEWAEPAAGDRGRRPGLAPVRHPQRALRGARARAAAGGHRRALVLPRAGAPAAGDGERSHPPAGASLPGTERAAREHLAIPISAAITREQVREVVDAVARCASGST